MLLKTQTKPAKTTNANTAVNPYQGLQDIAEAQAYDKTEDEELMHDLHKVLKKHNAVSRFGVTLLHDHFEIDGDEMLIETHDPQSRTLTIKPYRNSELKEPDNLQETSWRFTEEGEAVAMQACLWDGQEHHPVFKI
ncbi:hypothetical protein [Microscilla marina]|uniref:Uncharacterized protein n=1 Tax=Microscilla marina ATCC 23134 TaxID=313606 RepID=A1ZU86_MICM2|nr:hypothetical protein [Microscilla marina]EAY26057.1 hypothetical protein M23134_06406 [Microscilla marina ATCC 23134]